MENVYVIRYGEISLKGKNRVDFERKLVENIKKILSKNNIGFEKVERVRNRIYVYCDETDIFRYVFGVVNYSKAFVINFSLENVKEIAKNILADKQFETFRVSAKRLDNTGSSSMEIDREIGAFIESEFTKKVSLKEFDLDFGIETRAGQVYVFIEKKKGPAGLPVGISGTVVCKIENNASLLAALLVMKRGCDITIDNPNNIDLSLLEKYYPGILKSSQGEATVTGEILENLSDYGNEFILRPLIAFTEQEINNTLERYA